MKIKRTIIIKDPHLRRIRNNLRSVIISACSVEKSKSLDIENGDESKFWAIERPLRASILLCPACFQSDKDMTYNPVRKEWYCTGCYAELKKGFTKEGQPEQFP